MTRPHQNQSNLNIRQIVEQILSSGQMSHQDYIRLTGALLADFNLSNEERSLINQVFDENQIGRVKLVDW